jgi:hypothetical protein
MVHGQQNINFDTCFPILHTAGNLKQYVLSCWILNLQVVTTNIWNFKKLKANLSESPAHFII